MPARKRWTQSLGSARAGVRLRGAAGADAGCGLAGSAAGAAGRPGGSCSTACASSTTTAGKPGARLPKHQGGGSAVPDASRGRVVTGRARITQVLATTPEVPEAVRDALRGVDGIVSVHALTD